MTQLKTDFSFPDIPYNPSLFYQNFTFGFVRKPFLFTL